MASCDHLYTLNRRNRRPYVCLRVALNLMVDDSTGFVTHSLTEKRQRVRNELETNWSLCSFISMKLHLWSRDSELFSAKLTISEKRFCRVLNLHYRRICIALSYSWFTSTIARVCRAVKCRIISLRVAWRLVAHKCAKYFNVKLLCVDACLCVRECLWIVFRLYAVRFGHFDAGESCLKLHRNKTLLRFGSCTFHHYNATV